MTPVTGPRNPSGEKTGMNRRAADARFSTTGGISPDSPQSRSAACEAGPCNVLSEATV